jgi:hypothetical protein
MGIFRQSRPRNARSGGFRGGGLSISSWTASCVREGCRWARGEGGRPRRLSLKLWRCGALESGACTRRREGFREGGDRESEKLDRDGAELVEEGDGDGERGSREVWLVMATSGDTGIIVGNLFSISHPRNGSLGVGSNIDEKGQQLYEAKFKALVIYCLPGLSVDENAYRKRCDE